MINYDNNKINILILISTLEYGGAQRQVVELANNIDYDKFNVHICCLYDYTPLADHINKEKVNIHIINKKFKFDLSVVTRLATLLKKIKIDIIHSYLFDSEISARLAGKISSTPLVLGSERNANYKLKLRQIIAYRLTKKYVDFIIANSHTGANFNSKKLGHPISQYRVIHNGVNIVYFKPTDDNHKERHKLGIKDHENVIGMFASFKKQKNHEMIFKAAQLILDRIPNTRFMFVGDKLYKGMHGSDNYLKHMNFLVDKLNIRNKCLFLGNSNDVNKLYQICDVTVLPSLFEGTPNTVLESLACGVPVVATNVSDNSIIIPDGRAGFLVDVGDVLKLSEKICYLLMNRDERISMGTNAREWVANNFSTEIYVRKTENMYLELLDLKTSMN